MPKYRKTQDELETELFEQMAAFRSSLSSFDAGNHWEAKRIAASVYILCFDGTGRTKSLLGMLGHKAAMHCLSSKHDPETAYMEVAFVTPPTSLLMMRSDGGPMAYHPAFDYNIKNLPPKFVSFTKWWEEHIFHPATGVSLTRKNIVFSARTQDGGAHVDDHLTDLNYRLLRTVGQQNITVSVNGQTGGPPGNLVWPILRQIGWELDESLKKKGF